MKNILLIILITAGVLTGAAYGFNVMIGPEWGGGIYFGGPYYYEGPYYSPYYSRAYPYYYVRPYYYPRFYRRCGWEPSHLNADGYWIEGHRVCW